MAIGAAVVGPVFVPAFTHRALALPALSDVSLLALGALGVWLGHRGSRTRGRDPRRSPGDPRG